MKMMSNYSSIEGIGFAIPSSTVKSIVDALSVDGEVRGRPSIGITVGVIPDTARENYDLPEGLYISAVQENSDAAAKGIETGDILTAVNGVQVTTTQEVADIKEAMSVGDTLVLTIWRDGETMDIEVALVDTNDVY
jgi:serine protease Do